MNILKLLRSLWPGKRQQTTTSCSKSRVVSEYATHLAKNGGMANCGEHLGVFVSPSINLNRCPPGWIFIPLETASPDIVQECLDEAKKGRSAWPKKE